MLQSIRKSDVPEYLRAGEFYQSLGDEEDDLIDVPVQTVKSTSTTNNLSDLSHLLSSLRFWGVDSVPDEAFDLAFSLCGDEVEWHSLLLEFEVQFPTLVIIHKLLSYELQRSAIRCIG